jgi:hypothetical protein
MEAYEDYGAGPALVTQLAHVQETIERVSGFRKFAQLAAAANPKAQILAAYDAARNLLFGAEGTRTATSCRATAAKSGRT